MERAGRTCRTSFRESLGVRSAPASGRLSGKGVGSKRAGRWRSASRRTSSPRLGTVPASSAMAACKPPCCAWMAASSCARWLAVRVAQQMPARQIAQSSQGCPEQQGLVMQHHRPSAVCRPELSSRRTAAARYSAGTSTARARDRGTQAASWGSRARCRFLVATGHPMRASRAPCVVGRGYARS
jgi:hypothetical protein